MPLHKLRFGSWLCALLLLGSRVSVPAGPLQRVPNTSLNLPSSPPIFGYTSTNIFPSLTFTNPVSILAPPGETNRLFIVGKDGVICIITNLAAPNRTVFMNLSSQVAHQNANSSTEGEKGMLGMAFHPGFATNGFFYLVYMSTNSTQGIEAYNDTLSRFKINSANTNQGDPASEVVIYKQIDRDPNHNSGDVHFGADGYLYVTVGDEGSEHDGRNCAQIITNGLFAGLLRIDVDKKPGNLTPNPGPPSLTVTTNYLIPADNPLIGLTSFDGKPITPGMIRTEFYAVGLRNPWRWSFDFFTNSFGTNVLYCGDVGQDKFEEVDVIGKGDNLGWAYWEGTNVASGGSLPHTAYITNQGTNIRFPIVQYAHGSLANQGNCVIGGYVYRGSRLPQLYGSYVYGDYVSGNIWTLPASSFTTSFTNASDCTAPGTPIISDTTSRVTCFGVDPASGDILYAATKTTGFATSSTIQRIIYNNVTNGAPLPPTLAQTGAFTNLNSLTSPSDPLQPAAGIVPYDINVPFWSDNAIKSRWFSVPNTNLTVGFSSNSNWSFPTGTVWIKHFNLQLTNGDPSSEIRLETRLLVKNASGLYGVTYRWGGSQTNASLVAPGGMDESFVINDGGNLRTQIWHYPSQLECQACHTPEGGFGLGFRTEQLNKDYSYAGGTTNEIMALSDAGYFSAPVTTDLHSLIALATATNSTASLEFRSRSFLMANCSQCHQPGGSAQQASWDARITTPTALAGLINGTVANNLGSIANHVITPQSPANSVLLTRVSTRGAGTIEMPPLDSNLVDTEATNLLTQWILSLSNTFWIAASPNAQSIAQVGSANGSVAYVATPDFAGTVTFSVSGLPANALATFNPPTATSTTNILLTITTSGALNGTYPLTVNASSANQTNTDLLTLTVGTVFASPGTLIWNATNNVSVDTNWSTAINWTNTSAGGNGAPGPQNAVQFGNTGATTSPVTNNFVDANFTVGSLWYNNNSANTSPNYHVTRVNDGQTLTIAGGLTVGASTDAGGSIIANALITGANGTVLLTNGTLGVAQGSSTAGPHQAVLDLSRLGTLIVTNVSRINVAVAGAPPQPNSGLQRSSGVLYLARTNNLTVTSTGVTNGILIGWNDSQGNNGVGDKGSALYLGQTNAIFTDAIYTGTDKTLACLVAFNPSGLNNPVAYFRNKDGVGRISLWGIGDSSMKGNSNQSASGTNDFNGGTIDALIASMTIGVSQTGASSGVTGNGTGALIFNAGIIDVDNLTNGLSMGTGTSAGSDIGAGIINVNGSATLKVNNVLSLAQNTGTGTGVPVGIVTVNSGSLLVNTVVAGSGTSAINLNNATLTITNRVAAPNAPLGTLGTTNSSIHVRLNGSALTTNIVAANLNAAGVTAISVDSIANVAVTTSFPLITYSTFTGSIANFTVGSLPANFAGTLTNNAAAKRIDLIITHAPANPMISALSFSNTNLILSGTSGPAAWTYYLLASTNLSLPLSNWTAVQTGFFDGSGNFQLTNGADPSLSKRFYILQVP